ncbi:P-loop ATPase, Sll1717 family [Methylorubrum populi]
MANPIIFRRNIDIGAPDAESDHTYLQNCFVDTGDVGSLLDCTSNKSIVLGRTGAGKTALLLKVNKEAENAVELLPEALALTYVSNSPVLRFFEETGVSLDTFYALLWRHIITVELLKLRYGITNEDKQQEFLDKIRYFLVRNKSREKALSYLQNWGSQFWQETEYRTKEFTRKLETDLKANLKIDSQYVDAGLDGAKKLTDEEKIEVRSHGSRIVNEVQVKELSDVISLLSEDIFSDSHKRYYITIDRLDENWADNRIRLKLIKALLETVRTFRKVQNVKIIVALRNDLHFQMIKETAQVGFQEEKFRSFYLQVRWSRAQLIKVLEDRVNYMFKRQYTREGVKLSDILPQNQMDQRSSVDYIIDRTFFRPREAIIYLNECIARAEGQSRISAQLLRQAEAPYSQQRINALADEWRGEYPNLAKTLSILSRRPSPYKIGDFSDDDKTKLAIEILEAPNAAKDPIYLACEQFYLAGSINSDEFIREILGIMYHVGIVGVKIEPHLPRRWSYIDEPFIQVNQLRSDTQLELHKTFWAALGTHKEAKRSN